MKKFIIKSIAVFFIFFLHGEAFCSEELGEVRLSKEEIDFLAESCPDVCRAVDRGYAVVYGNMVKLPILVCQLMERYISMA